MSDKPYLRWEFWERAESEDKMSVETEQFDPEKVLRRALPISGGIVPAHPPTGAVFAMGTGTAPKWVLASDYDKLLVMYREASTPCPHCGVVGGPHLNACKRDHSLAPDQLTITEV